MDVNELFLDGILHAWQPFDRVCKISQPFAQFVKKLDFKKFTNTMVFWGKKSPKFEANLPYFYTWFKYVAQKHEDVQLFSFN
jgi:hypothetical protein